MNLVYTLVTLKINNICFHSFYTNFIVLHVSIHLICGMYMNLYSDMFWTKMCPIKLISSLSISAYGEQFYFENLFSNLTVS